MRISDWSSDVCSSDLSRIGAGADAIYQVGGAVGEILGLRIVHAAGNAALEHMVQKIGLGRAVGAAVDDAIHLSLRKEPPHRLTIVARRGSVLGDERLAELLAGERIGRVVQPAVAGDEIGRASGREK